MRHQALMRHLADVIARQPPDSMEFDMATLLIEQLATAGAESGAALASAAVDGAALGAALAAAAAARAADPSPRPRAAPTRPGGEWAVSPATQMRARVSTLAVLARAGGLPAARMAADEKLPGALVRVICARPEWHARSCGAAEVNPRAWPLHVPVTEAQHEMVVLGKAMQALQCLLERGCVLVCMIVCVCMSVCGRAAGGRGAQHKMVALGKALQALQCLLEGGRERECVCAACIHTQKHTQNAQTFTHPVI